jgi:hypothetical protein
VKHGRERAIRIVATSGEHGECVHALHENVAPPSTNDIATDNGEA